MKVNHEQPRDLDKLLKGLNTPYPSEEQMNLAATQVLHRLRVEHSEDPSLAADFTAPRPARLQRWPAAGAAVAAVLILGVLPFLFTRGGGMPTAAYAVVETIDGNLYRVSGSDVRPLARNERIGLGQTVLASGGGTVLALNDGSRIEMRAESSLWLTSSTDGVQINLRLGDVIVTAADQAGGTLSVRTRDYDVSVIGTVFGVNTNATGSRVFVIEGEVRVGQGEKLETLKPGQQIASNPALTLPIVQDNILWSRNASGHLALLQGASAGMPVHAGDDTALASVEGSVTQFDTGEPVRNAQVALIAVQFSRGDMRASALTVPPVETDRNGRFFIPGVEPGLYRVTAARNGFVRQEYGQPSERRPGMVLVVEPRQRLGGVDFKLVRTGTISGRIVDTTGEPLANINVELLRAGYDENGNRTLLTAVPSLRTNDLGEYRFFWISPGRYYVRADAIRSPLELALRSPASGVIVNTKFVVDALERNIHKNEVVKPDYAPSYYPGGAQSSMAQAIHLRPGEQLAGIDLRLESQQLFRVRGRVIDGTTGQPSRLGGIDLHPLDGGGPALPTSRYDRATGSFEVHNVPPGIYEGQVSILPPDPRSMPSRSLLTQIEVTNHDVDNLLFVAGPPVPVRGRVLIEGALPTPPVAGISVALFSATQFGNSATVSSAGDFEISVTAGEYRVSVANLPPGAFVKSIQSGRTEVLHTPMAVRLDHRDALEVVISLAAGEIKGTVLDRLSTPRPGISVILIPQERSRRDLYRTAGTGPAGDFQIQGIPPGNYDLFAWEDIEPFAYFDPDVLRNYETFRQTVHVGEGARLSTSLRLIPNLSQ